MRAFTPDDFATRRPALYLAMFVVAGLAIGLLAARGLQLLFAVADCGASGVAGLLCGFGMFASIVLLPVVELGARLWGHTLMNGGADSLSALYTLGPNGALLGLAVGILRLWLRRRR